MHLLYLDDSGSINNQNEEYFVLGGICVPETSVRWLTYQLEKTASEVDPANPRQVEFHASEIFSGRIEPWDRFPKKSDRIEIIKKMLRVLDHAYPGIVIFACAIHKRSFPADDPFMKAFEDLSSRFNMYLQRNPLLNDCGNKGLIILDRSSHENILQNLATTFREQGNRWGDYLKNICEVPLFIDSKASRIIQLADHISYAVFRRYNAGDLTYFNCIEGRFDQNEGVIHGLAHWQTYTPRCTCPACITRRSKESLAL
jgi:hypothetical protein